MNILILDLNKQKNSLHKEEFVTPIETIVKKITKNYEIIHFKDNFKIEKYTHIILSGTSLSDFEYLNHVNKFDFIKQTTTPILGICAGAQIISMQFGKKLIENEEIGLVKVVKQEDNEILEDLQFPLEVYELHKKVIEVPISFKILLQNENPQLIKHKFKRIYACVFHPEVRNHKLIHNFIIL